MKQLDFLIKKISDENLWDKQISLKRNEYLKVSGSVDLNFYFILSGSLRVFILDKYEEHTIRFGYKNNFIGDLGSFISEKPSEYYIQALKKTELKVIGKQTIMSIVDTSPELQKGWIEILEHVILTQLERERDILTSAPIERYNRVIQRSPLLFQEIPLRYIASYLRMTPETLSRIKKY